MKWLNPFNRRKSDLPDFTGKVVVIYCAFPQGGGVFEGVRLVEVGFSQFIVGRKVEFEPSREGRSSGATAWFCISAVAQMYIYDDVAEARKAHNLDLPDRDPPDLMPQRTPAIL